MCFRDAFVKCVVHFMYFFSLFLLWVLVWTALAVLMGSSCNIIELVLEVPISLFSWFVSGWVCVFFWLGIRGL